MKFTKRLLILLSLFILIVAQGLPAGAASESENVALVRKMFEAIDGDGDVSILTQILDTVDNMEKRSEHVATYVEIPIMDLTLDEPYEGFVHYTCKIPSAAAITLLISGFDLGYGVTEINSVGDPVSVEGYLSVFEFGDSGLCVDISDGASPLALYFDLTFYNGDLSFMDKDSYSYSDIEPIVTELGEIVSNAYGKMLGEPDYYDDQRKLNIKSAVKYAETLWTMLSAEKVTNSSGSGSTKGFKGFVTKYKRVFIFIGGIIVLIILVFVIATIADAIDKKKKKKKDSLSGIPSISELIALYKKVPDKLTNQQLHEFHNAVNQHRLTKAGYKEFTQAGWALAALGKAISLKATPSSFKRAIGDFERCAKDFNSLVEKFKKLEKQIEEARNKRKKLSGSKADLKEDKRLNKQIEKMSKEHDKIEEALKDGLLYYLIKRKITPFGYLMHILNDSQWQFDRFMKQGAIMGLLDFLMKYRNDSTIKKYFDQLIAVRASLINNDAHMSFFEVRVDYGDFADKISTTENLEKWRALAETTLAEKAGSPLLDVEISVSYSGISYKKTLFTLEGFEELLSKFQDLLKYHTYDRKTDGTLAEILEDRIDMLTSEIKESRNTTSLKKPSEGLISEYSYVLSEVLRCANPTLKYTDITELLKTAIKKIPSVMELLLTYPLRLIDPGKEDEQGFFEFTPYRHSGWIQYTPPLYTGQVIRRFHEVLDQTIPNSSGLNVRLFTDKYLPIPTMFHEFCHYKGDRNEASVWLRTQMFSLELYKKAGKDSSNSDWIYKHLVGMLGEEPDVAKLKEFNALIKQIYGDVMSKDKAKQTATQRIATLNQRIAIGNKMERWCPQIKMPLLSEEPGQDAENMRKIVEILVRYHTAPRSITKDNFTKIVADYM
ncbi:MAG: hypothetical protein LBQ95_03015 [Lachnospiraceae bacterium]|jgi:hypothetical protein|nr:hypothetical protein [Lachnospiraceae bacterium]